MKDRFLSLARSCGSMLDFMAKMGWQGDNLSAFTEWAEAQQEGISLVVKRNEALTTLNAAIKSGDQREIRSSRIDLLMLTNQIIDTGLSAAPAANVNTSALFCSPSALSKECRQRPRQKTGHFPFKTTAVKTESLSCEVMRGLAVGDTGEKYEGYPVVRIQLRPGIFGCEMEGRSVCRTLHHGMINHAEVESGKPPTASWVVLMAMLELGQGGKSFTKERVLGMAEDFLAERNLKYRREQLVNAWNLLKTHHNHPTTCQRGYSYMVEDHPDGGFVVRPRDAKETVDLCRRSRKTR